MFIKNHLYQLKKTRCSSSAIFKVTHYSYHFLRPPLLFREPESQRFSGETSSSDWLSFLWIGITKASKAGSWHQLIKTFYFSSQEELFWTWAFPSFSIVCFITNVISIGFTYIWPLSDISPASPSCFSGFLQDFVKGLLFIELNWNQQHCWLLLSFQENHRWKIQNPIINGSFSKQ